MEIVNDFLVEILGGLILTLLLEAWLLLRLCRRVNVLENHKIQMNIGQMNAGQINIGQQLPASEEAVSSTAIDHIVAISQAGYDALPEKDERTLYLIK